MPFQFQLFGFPVIVDTGFFVLLGIYGLFGIQRQQPVAEIVGWCIIVFLSILVHELGHAFAAQAFKLPVGRIKLHGFGGDVTHAAGTAGQQVLVSLAGPMAGISLGLIVGVPLLFYGPHNETADYLWGAFMFVNVGWSVVNLLPMFPLDGGQALGFFLQFLGFNAWRWVFVLGFLLGIGVAAFGLYIGQLFLLILAGMAATTNYQLYQQDRNSRTG